MKPIFILLTIAFFYSKNAFSQTFTFTCRDLMTTHNSGEDYINSFLKPKGWIFDNRKAVNSGLQSSWVFGKNAALEAERGVTSYYNSRSLVEDVRRCLVSEYSAVETLSNHKTDGSAKQCYFIGSYAVIVILAPFDNSRLSGITIRDKASMTNQQLLNIGFR